MRKQEEIEQILIFRQPSVVKFSSLLWNQYDCNICQNLKVFINKNNKQTKQIIQLQFFIIAIVQKQQKTSKNSNKNNFHKFSKLINLMSKSRRLYHLIQPFQSINKSPTNRSASKQTHSFSKSERFPPIKYYNRCPRVYYAGQNIRTNKNKAGIGIGPKSDFTKDLTCSPSCAKYRLKDNFQKNKQYKKGFPIGSSRDTVKFASYISRQMERNPPANRYNIKYQYNKKTNPIFSMGSRTKIHDKLRTIQPLNENPGPGQYRNAQVDRKSIHLMGEKKTSFSSSKSERFPKSSNRSPGPGTYDQVSNLSNVGRYYVSRHRGGTIAKFLTERRVTQFDKAAQKSLQIPGAGTYKAPSQFGNFVDEQINQRLKNITVTNPNNSNKKQD